MSFASLVASLLAVSTFRAVGLVIMAIVVVGFVIYSIVNVRAGRAEVGAEIELAPNRKPYLRDDELEGPKLDRSLGLGLVTLAVVAVGLPVYWLSEPGRHDGAIKQFDSVFVSQGSKLFATTADHGYNCAGCHGPEGVGGSASYTITDENDEFVAQVNWQAPALNTVLLRYTIEEVRYILNYGRPFSPMPAWGTIGGGPLNEQQVDNLIAYMDSIQLEPEAAQAAAKIELNKAMELKGEDGQPVYASEGEALFNLGRESGFAGGAYSCGRCHTQGWSFYSDANAPDGTTEVPDGAGAFGPNLTNGATKRQFETVEAMLEFVTLGSVDGQKYGVHGQGSGRMPGFGDNPDDKDDLDDDDPGDGMLTEDMIKKIIQYERSL